MNYRLYWLLRKYITSILFFFKKQRYRYMEYSDRKDYIKPIEVYILKTILKQVLVSIFAVSVMVGLDYFILITAKIAPFDGDLYKELLLAGMGIAGVILGLYCANIASIFSAKYSNVPNSISHDFQNDIITKSAIKEIVGYTQLEQPRRKTRFPWLVL